MGEVVQLQHEVLIPFDEFWSLYPRKFAKKDAHKAWLQTPAEHYPAIMAALPAHKRQEQWLKDGGAFIPYPASWLRGERWTDELGPDLGQCSWNLHGNRSSEPRCTEPATGMAKGVGYCARHKERA